MQALKSDAPPITLSSQGTAGGGPENLKQAPKYSRVCPLCGKEKHLQAKRCRACFTEVLRAVHRDPAMIDRLREVRRANGRRGKGRTFTANTKAKMASAQRERFKKTPVWNKGRSWTPAELAAIMAGLARRGPLNRTPTSIERTLYKILERTGMTWERETKIGYYQVDAFIPALRAAIEANGNYWHSLPKARSRDRAKATYLSNREFSLLVLTETELRDEAEATKKVLAWIESLKLSPATTPALSTT